MTPGDGLDAGGDVDAERVHGGDRLGDVLGRQPAGQDQRDLRAPLRGAGSSPTSGRCRRACRSRAASSRWKSVWKRSSVAQVGAVADAAAALITLQPVRCADRGAERRALVAVQLHVGERRARRRRAAISSSGGLTNTPTSSTRRRSARAIPAATRGSSWRAERGPEDEPDRPGAELDRQLGVLEARDAADLDPGHGSIVGPGGARRSADGSDAGGARPAAPAR